jgi:hypothetical protein
MTNDPRGIVNPIHFNIVVPGSSTALTSPDVPGKILIKSQVMMPPTTNPQTFLIHLSPADARQLHVARGKCLKGTAN